MLLNGCIRIPSSFGVWCVVFQCLLCDVTVSLLVLVLVLLSVSCCLCVLLLLLFWWVFVVMVRHGDGGRFRYNKMYSHKIAA